MATAPLSPEDFLSSSPPLSSPSPISCPLSPPSPPSSSTVSPVCTTRSFSPTSSPSSSPLLISPENNQNTEQRLQSFFSDPLTEIDQHFMNSIRTDKIACIGAGYVGGPTMAVLAQKCPHIQVFVLDISESRIAAWNSDELPIFEPGLDEIVRNCRGRNLHFSTDISWGVKNCDLIFVSVNTPTKKIGVGAGAAADLTAWESAGRSIAEKAESHKIIIEKSTVPVRTAEALARVLEANEQHNVKFSILSNPEFMAEGSAISDLSGPDRVLIGGNETTAIGQFSIRTLAKVYSVWVSEDKIITTNLWSSELSKLVANAFLAQRISSINAISQLCEKTGADVSQVAYAIGKDSRIGAKFLEASVGFGGSCFQKDLLNLVYLCKTFNLPEVSDYWNQVVLMNDHQKRHFSNRIIDAMFKTVKRKKIAVFGFAFKKNTGDTRETPALDVCAHLMEDGAFLHVYDPKVTREQALLEFAEHGTDSSHLDRQFIMESSPEAAVLDCHAIVVLTDWPEFKDFDYSQFVGMMKKPAFLFDGRNILDHRKLWKCGFEIHAIGKASLLQASALQRPDSSESLHS